MDTTEIDYIKGAVLRKFPHLGVALSGLKIRPLTQINTAATDGKTVYYSPEFFDPLKDEEKVFIIAHEVMHVAFNHILRSKDRDEEVWNIATDAVINQILKAENLPLVEGGVDMPEALHCSADEMYEKLKQKKDDLENKQLKMPGQDNNDSKGSSGGKGNSSKKTSDNQAGHDQHDIWKKAVKEIERQKAKSISDETDYADMEKNFSEMNRAERQQKAAEIIRKMRQDKDKALSQTGVSGSSMGPVGVSKAAVDWKKRLKKTLQDNEDRWSYRRACAENDYSARCEELEDENKSETEVLLDCSGSVNVPLLKEFLRQLKTLLDDANIKVGCFDDRFFGFSEVKSQKDIDGFKIKSQSGMTGNESFIVGCFSKKRDINKIVFTDGYLEECAMSKKENVIWLVYGNERFAPSSGKAIQINPLQIKERFISALYRGRD